MDAIIPISIAVAIGLGGLSATGYLSKVYSIGVYAYPVTRMRVMNSRSIKNEKLSSLLESYNTRDIIAAFESTDYEEHIPETTEIKEIEKSLSKALASTYKKVVNMSPTAAKQFFNMVSSRYDVENLKKIIAAKYAKKEVTFLLPSTFSEAFVQKLLDANSVSEIIEMCKETKYKEILEKISQDAHPSEYEKALDNYLYGTLLSKGKLWGLATNAGVLNDADYLIEVYGLKADAINIKIALRAKQGALNSEQTKELMLKNGYDLDEKKRTQLSESENITTVINSLEGTRFFDPVNEAMQKFNETKKVFTLEKAIEETYIKEIRSIFLKQAFGLTPIACYLILKENEVSNLTTMMKGIESGLPKQRLGELMVGI